MNDTPSQPRTLHLIERKPYIVRLAPADVAYLLEHHRRHIEVQPTGRRDRYRITALGCAGVLTTPLCRFVIKPKIPLVNLFALLDPLADVAAGQDSITPQTGLEALEFLTGQLARRMSERVIAGLHRAYRERCEQGRVLLGRLDLSAQLRQAPGRKEQLHSQYEELSTDIPCNQAVKACAELLLSSPLVSLQVRATLRKALDGFEDVSSIPISPRLWEAVQREKLPTAYHSLLGLGRLLVESLTLGNALGSTPAPSFLLDLESVFERYVTRGIVEAFASSRNYGVGVQVAYTVNQTASDQSDITMRPDLTIERAGRTMLVIDAKWKRWTGSAEPADLYQVMAYGMALGAEGVVLVFPGTRWRCQKYRFNDTPLRLMTCSLRVRGTREACLRSVHKLVRAFKALDRG